MSADDKEDTTHEEIPKLFRPLRVFCHILGAADKNISTMHRWGVLELGAWSLEVFVLLWLCSLGCPRGVNELGPGPARGRAPFFIS